jgi:hypothetical protein
MHVLPVLPVLLVLLNASSAPRVVDPCTNAVPTSLARTLAKANPGYRLPSRSDEGHDIPAPLLAAARRSGSGECMAVAAGDFDGDGHQDFALLLPRAEFSVASAPVRLVVAMRRGNDWSLRQLPSSCGSAEWCYVGVVEPGTYRRTASMPEPLAPGEVRILALSHQGLSTGKLESTCTIFGLTRGAWSHVWVAQ